MLPVPRIPLALFLVLTLSALTACDSGPKVEEVRALQAQGRFEAFSHGDIDAESIVTAFADPGSSVRLTAAGAGGIDVGEISAGEGQADVFLDSALGVQDRDPKAGSVVVANRVGILAGLGANVRQLRWTIAGDVSVRHNRSVFVDAASAAGLRGLGAVIDAQRDIFIGHGVHLDLAGDVRLEAGRNLVFLDGSSLSNRGGRTHVLAGGSLDLLGGAPLFGGGGGAAK